MFKIFGMRSLAELSGDWNIQTHIWLKYYCMLRMIDRSKRGIQIWPACATYVISSYWHGVDPGYLSFFFSLAIMHIAIVLFS